MYDWIPYLQQLFGTGSDSYTNIDNTLSFKGILEKSQPLAERSSWLEALLDLEAVKQVFLLPWALSWLQGATPLHRRQLGLLAGQLVDSAARSHLENAVNLFGSQLPTPRNLKDLLGYIADEFVSCSEDVEADASFALIFQHRRPIFYLALLLEVTSWLVSRGPDSPALSDMRDFFQAEEQDTVRQVLDKWLVSGPFFIRFLLVEWLGRSGVRVEPTTSCEDSMYARYLEDNDPVVTVAAAVAYVRCAARNPTSGGQDVTTSSDPVAKAEARLLADYRGFLHRKLDWGASPLKDAAQTVSCGLLFAISELAAAVFPRQSSLNALVDCLRAHPAAHLNLLRSHLEKSGLERLLRAAVLLHGENLSLYVRVPPRAKGLFGYAGQDLRIRISDPHNLRPSHPNASHFWARPMADGDDPEPLFRLEQVCQQGERLPFALDLVALCSPIFSDLKIKRPKLVKKEEQTEAHTRAAEEMRVRERWMINACQVTATFLSNIERRGFSLTQPGISDTLWFLGETAKYSCFVCYSRYGEEQKPRELLRQLRKVFLNHLANTEVFDFLFPGDRLHHWDATLLTEMVGAALDGVPGTPAQNWIKGNIHRLETLARFELYAYNNNKIRGAACLTLSLYADNSEFDVAEVVRSKPFFFEAVFRQYPQIMPLVTDNDLKCFLANQNGEWRTPDSILQSTVFWERRKNAWSVVWAEVVARVLEGRWHDLPRLEEAAAVVILSLAHHKIMPLIRLRLLVAFARCRWKPEGNLRRLLEQLLHVASARQLEIYWRLKAQVPGGLDALDLSRLVLLLEGGGGTSRRGSQGLLEARVRRKILLSVLGSLVRSKPHFFTEYMECRRTDMKHVESRSVTLAEGRPLEREEKPDVQLLPQVWSALEASNPGTSWRIADQAGDPIPFLIHQPDPEAPLRCLVRFTPIAAPVADFHLLSHEKPELRQRMLEKRMAEDSPVFVAARVKEVKSGTVIADLGVELPQHLPSQMTLPATAHEQADDCLVGMVVPRQDIKVSKIRFSGWCSASEGLDVLDLSGSELPEDILRHRWHQGSPLWLKAKVKNRIPTTGDKLLCLLDAGFQVFAKEKPKPMLPALLAPRVSAPEEGALVYAAANEIEFRPGEGGTELRGYTLAPAPSQGLLSGEEITVTIHARRRNEYRRRGWSGCAGGALYDIPRQELTQDLRKLFALDELADDDPLLDQLANYPVTARVLGGGSKLSLLAAAPVLRTADLIMAVAAGQVSAVIFVRACVEEHSLLVELTLPSNKQPASSSHSLTWIWDLPLLGGLVLLHEEDLLDSSNRPVVPNSLKPGEVLPLTVWYHETEYGAAGERLPVPNLKLAGAKDCSNTDFRNCYQEKQPVRIRVVDQHRFEVVDRIAGFPHPTIAGFSPRAMQTTPPPGYTMEAEVTRWEPCALDFRLTVARPHCLGLHWGMGLPQLEAATCLDLAVGDVIPADHYTFRESRGGKAITCYAGNFPVVIDQTLALLLPGTFRADLLNQAHGKAPLRIVDIVRSRPQNLGALALDSVKHVGFLKEQEYQAEGVVVEIRRPKRGDKGKGQDVVLAVLSRDRSQMGRVEFKLGSQPDSKSAPHLMIGDVICIRGHCSSGERVPCELSVVKEPREVVANFFHSVGSLDAVLSGAPDGNHLQGVLLAKPREVCGWFFSFAPAVLVEAGAEVLSGAEHLEDAWPLDLVEAILHQTAEGQLLRITGFKPGPLRRLRSGGVPVPITLLRRGRDGQCRVTIGDSGIELSLPANRGIFAADIDLRRWRESLRQNRAKESERHFFLDHFRLEHTLKTGGATAEKSASPYHHFTLQLKFRSRLHCGQETALSAKQDLMAVLRTGGFLEGATGRSVNAGDPSGCLEVALDHYEHAELLPLPVVEQSWLPQSENFVRPGMRPFAVFLELVDGAPRAIASLRRLRPVYLSEWLRHMKPGAVIHSDRPLRYVGRPDREFLEQWGEDVLSAEDAALFEIVPGETVLARSDQLRFLGHDFSQGALRHGDQIVAFRVLDLSEEIADSEDPAAHFFDRGLEILWVHLDICHEIEVFASRQGFFFGKLAIADQVHLVEVYGMGGHGRPFEERSRGRWKYRLEPRDCQASGYVLESHEEEFIYLKFLRVDHDSGEIVFCAAETGEVFANDSLVFVRAEETAASGESMKLVVKPLQAVFPGQYYIPDTLYSIRPDRLEKVQIQKGHIFLARVYDRESRDGGDGFRLSLLEVPPRPFSYLMNRSHWRAIVKERKSSMVWVEVGDGLIVEIPTACLILPEEVTKLQRGDVLMLKTKTERYEVEVADLIRSHLHYVAGHLRRTFLTRLWGTIARRRKILEEGKQLNCGLVGLPQLVGLTTADASVLEEQGTIPQIVEGRGAKFVNLHPGIATGDLAGRLSVSKGAVTLCLETGEALPMPWKSVTVRKGRPHKLAAWLRAVTWKNSWRTDYVERVPHAHVQGRFDGSGHPSLVAMAEHPFPMDHLVEQVHRKGTEQSRRSSIEISVGFSHLSSDGTKMVVEIAPGRYTELHLSMLQRLFPDAKGSAVLSYWDNLVAGDVLSLSPAYGHGMEEKLLPDFRINRIVPTAARFLLDPFSSRLTRAAGGQVWLGGEAGPQLDCDCVTGLEDEILDLRSEPDREKRATLLREAFERVGSRLVLTGAVQRSIEQGPELMRHFVEVGILFPKPGQEGKLGQPCFIAPRDAIFEPGARIAIRMISVQWDEDGKLKSAWVEAAGCSVESGCVIRVDKKRQRRHIRAPRPGDSVLVLPTDPEASSIAVAGFEDHSVLWYCDENDGLNWRSEKERRHFLPALFHAAGGGLWATVEAVNGDKRTLVLSRRNQLARALPPVGRSVRARVVNSVRNDLLLVSLLGVPLGLQGANFCYGCAPLRELGEILAARDGGHGLEIEVTLLEDGSLSALAAYHLPLHAEFQAQIEEVTSCGLLACANGSRIFVSSRELSWCPLDRDELEYFFPRGQEITLTAILGDREYSLIATSQVRREVGRLFSHDEPIVVTVGMRDPAKNRAIVRSQSGALMEVALTENDLPPRFMAFPHSRDNRRRRIVVGLDRRIVPMWNFPSTIPGYEIDCFTTGTIEAALENLTALLREKGAETLLEWGGRQHGLAPIPRNVRLTLEAVRQELGDDPDWEAIAAASRPTLAEGGELTAKTFGAVLREIAELLANRHPGQPGAIATFGVGYWHLVCGKSPVATLWLKEAAKATVAMPDFDILFCLARGLYQSSPVQATKILRDLTNALWGNALQTMALPLLPPSAADPTDPVFSEWEEALQAGNFKVLKRLINQISAYSPSSPETLSRRLWCRVVEGDTGELHLLAEDFLRALKAAENHQQQRDPRLFLVASIMSFAKGDHGTGWYFLDRIESEPCSEVKTALFWKTWLRSGTSNATVGACSSPHTELLDESTLLIALIPILRQCRWRDCCSSNVLDEAWNYFRTCRHHWVLERPLCHPFPSGLYEIVSQSETSSSSVTSD